MRRAGFVLFFGVFAGASTLWLAPGVARAELYSVEVEEGRNPPADGVVLGAAAPLRQKQDRRLAQEQGPIRKSLEDALTKIPDLTPEQQKLFKDEILPRGKSFVSHVHAGAEGKVRVDVDLAAIRGYLALKAPVVSNRKTLPKILLALQPTSDCGSCVSAEQAVFQAFQLRMKRRGFEVESIELDASSPALTAPYLREKISEAGAWGAAGIKMARKGLDSVDTAHLEDQGYALEILWSLPGTSNPVETIEKLDTQPGEAVLEGVDRGMTASLIRIGASASQLASSTQGDSSAKRKGRPEVSLRLEGFRNYADYIAIRSQLQEWASGEMVLRERRFEAGKVWFSGALALMQPGEEISDLAAMGDAIVQKFQKKAAKLGNPGGLETSWDQSSSELLLSAHKVEVEASQEAAPKAPKAKNADSEGVEQ